MAIITLQNIFDAIRGRFDNEPNKVEVDSSVLPAGASTEVKQDTLIAKDFATSAKQDEANAILNDIKIATENTLELYGADTSTRPDANTVDIGTTFMVVQTDPIIYQSNGTDWVVIS